MEIAKLVMEGNFSEFEDEIVKYGGNFETYCRGTIIINSTSPGKRTSYYIKKGIAKIVLTNCKGKETNLIFISKGSISPIVWDDKVYALESMIKVIALTDIEVIAIATKSVVHLMKDNSEFSLSVAKRYFELANALITKNCLSSYENCLDIVKAYLYIIASQDENHDNIIKLSQTELAKIIGISRVQLNRALAVLRKEKMLETERQKIIILDYEKLKKNGKVLLGDW